MEFKPFCSDCDKKDKIITDLNKKIINLIDVLEELNKGYLAATDNR